MYNHIKVTPNKNNVGAIIEAELSKFNNDIIEEVKDALAEYGVVFFRNQLILIFIQKDVLGVEGLEFGIFCSADFL